MANLEGLIADMIKSRTLKVGPVAQWHDGKIIRIAGRIKLRGYFADVGVRWLCEGYGDKGLFGKGYVDITERPAPECVVQLPVVK